MSWYGLTLLDYVVVAVGITAAMFGLYAFYYHTSEEWWYLRFVVPAFPALVLAGAAMLLALTACSGSERCVRAGPSGRRRRAVLLGPTAPATSFVGNESRDHGRR